MANYRDEIQRLTLPQIRAQFAPREFRIKDAVTVEAEGVRAQVKIVREPSTTAKGNRRTWLACPKCGGRTHVIGVVMDGEPRWACARCTGWRSRPRSQDDSSSSKGATT